MAEPSALPPGWQRGAFTEIFVRRWNGGTLRGVTARLDDLAELGITGIWLMPIHPSEDNDHGYAVSDYRGIHADYGTQQDFDALLDAAHARGVGVILDYVINHSASTHPLFTERRRASDSPLRA